MQMRPNAATAGDAGSALDDFAAELTRAAYTVALRHGAGKGGPFVVDASNRPPRELIRRRPHERFVNPRR